MAVSLQMRGGSMTMNNGMIPVPGHAGPQLPSMVPVGGMQPNNGHMAQPMPGALSHPPFKQASSLPSAACPVRTCLKSRREQ